MCFRKLIIACVSRNVMEPANVNRVEMLNGLGEDGDGTSGLSNSIRSFLSVILVVLAILVTITGRILIDLIMSRS